MRRAHAWPHPAHAWSALPRRFGEAAVVLRAAMSGFGAVAPLLGSSAAAGGRKGSSDSLEKIDMSLGKESAAVGRRWRGAG